MLLLCRREGNPFPERVFGLAGGRKTGLKRPLAHARSPRDNCFERRIFPPNPLEIAVAAPVFNLPTTI